MSKPAKRPLTPAYVIFYILFWPDTWRLLAGLLLSLVFTPRIMPADLSTGGRAMLYVMVAAIGWALAAKPSTWISGHLKKLLIGK